MDWKNFERIENYLVLFLKYGRKIPVEEQNFQKRDEVHFMVNLYSFALFLVPQGNLCFPKVSHLPLFQAEQLPNPPSSRHVDNSLSLYRFLKFEPQLSK